MFNSIANQNYSANKSRLDESTISDDVPEISHMVPTATADQEGVPYQRTNDGRIIHKNPKPIIISSGDFTGAGREYRYPLGPGYNCEMMLTDGVTVCQAQGYWYCDQTMSCCGAYTFFRGCGKIMCDRHCKKQYGDQYN